MDFSSQQTERSDDGDDAEARRHDVEIVDVWRIIWMRRSWLLAATLGLVALVGAYCLLTPPLYSATSQILIDPRDRQVLTNDINPTATAPDGGVTQVESQSKVLESSGVLLRMIEKLDLTRDAEFGAKEGLKDRIFGTLFSGPGWSREGPTEADRLAITLRNVKRRLGIKRADKVFVIDVTLTSRDREKAALMVNTIVDSYLVDQADSKTDAALQASNALSSRLEEQREKVRDAANAVATYKAENNIVEANNLLVDDQSLSELSAELTSAQSRTALLRTRLSQVPANGAFIDDATAEAMKSSTISQLRNQEATLVQTASQMRLELGPRHPSIRKVESQLSDLHRLIEEELARLKQASRNDFDRARAYERELGAKLRRLKDGKVIADQTFVQLRELERELDARRTVYSSYLLRSEETREQAGVDATNVRIISRAVPPQDTSWPPSALLVLAALSCGLGLGAAAALLAEYLAPTILSRSQMQKVSGTFDIGIIPLTKPPRRRRFAPRLPWTVPPALSLPPIFAAGTDPSISQQRMELAIALALGRLRKTGRDGGRSVLVTSGRQENDDRRTIVQFIAAAAAVQGLRVLFVDADPDSRPDMPQPGLLDVLGGERTLASLIRFDAKSGIAILGFGQRTKAAPRAGAAEAARQMLAEACKSFDLIIVDGGVVAEDMRVWPLVSAVDEVIFAAKFGHTRKIDVTTAMEALNSIGRTISATLLIRPPQRA